MSLRVVSIAKFVVSFFSYIHFVIMPFILLVCFTSGELFFMFCIEEWFVACVAYDCCCSCVYDCFNCCLVFLSFWVAVLVVLYWWKVEC